MPRSAKKFRGPVGCTSAGAKFRRFGRGAQRAPACGRAHAVRPYRHRWVLDTPSGKLYLVASATPARLAVVGIDAPVVPLVAPAVAFKAVARAEVAAPLPVAVAVPVAAAEVADVALAIHVHATVVVAVLVPALVLGMAAADARLVAVAGLDVALDVAAPRAAHAALLDLLRTPAIRPARVAGVVAIDVRLPAVARTAIGIGHLVLGVVRADVRLVISSAEPHGSSFQGTGHREQGTDGVLATAPPVPCPLCSVP